LRLSDSKAAEYDGMNVPDMSDGVRQVHALRDINALAVVKSLQLGESIRITLHQVGQPVKELSALHRGDIASPRRLKRFA
jgi:hypothetical protein